VITVRRARPTDAAAIGAVHVAAWRSTYPGILPDSFLSKLSIPRQSAHYDNAIRSGVGVHVAIASGVDLGRGGGPARIVGFVTDGPARGFSPDPSAPPSAPPRVPGGRLGDGEIETLYVLDDWRERGVGRRLMRSAAAHLASAGCRSAFLWVLRDNPSRWFYTRLGGKPAAEATILVGGSPVVQTAYVWEPIEKLAQATSQAS
jgi:GNAT superfamily N-acetyltransferase